MKITNLEVENIKRVKAVRISTDGSPVVTVGGRNAQGKTSVLDSIEYALGGKPKTARPIRDGEANARVVIETEELRVTRTFSEGGSRLIVEGLDGARYKSPQTVLDGLYGELTFDPLAFARKAAKEQADALKALVGIDLSPLDADRQAAYEERTLVNREVKALESQVNALPAMDIDPVSVADLTVEMERIYAHNRALAAAAEGGRRLEKEQREIEDRIEGIGREIERLQCEKLRLAGRYGEVSREIERMDAEVEQRGEKLDPEPIRARIREAEAINAKAAESRKRQDLQEQLALKRNEAASLSAKIEAIDEEKRLTLAEAEFPVDGLAFDESGVTYRGVPFEQCSSAEQLRVSMAIGMAHNPELKIMLIRDGSLLDSESLKTIYAMAEERGYQVWIEIVSETGEGCQVVIEDGAVAVREEVAHA